MSYSTLYCFSGPAPSPAFLQPCRLPPVVSESAPFLQLLRGLEDLCEDEVFFKTETNSHPWGWEPRLEVCSKPREPGRARSHASGPSDGGQSPGKDHQPETSPKGWGISRPVSCCSCLPLTVPSSSQLPLGDPPPTHSPRTTGAH